MSRPAQARAEDSGDVDIVRRIRAGDRTAVDDLLERFSRPAFALARRVLDEDGVAEDVLRDVFLSIWRDPGAFDRGHGSFTSWVLAMVQHRAVDVVRREEAGRRRRHRESAVAACGEIDEALIAGCEAAVGETVGEAWCPPGPGQVHGVLAVLPSLQREALTLAYYGGYTQREVAALTGTPLGTVKTRMLAAMRRLRAELGGTPGGTALGGALGGAAPVDGANR